MCLQIIANHICSFCSDQWDQSLAADAQRHSLAASALQQRPFIIIFLLSGQSAASSHLRRAAAEQTQALPHNTAAVRQRHLARDRRERPEPGAGAGGASLTHTLTRAPIGQT